MGKKHKTFLDDLNSILSNPAINKIQAGDFPDKLSSGELEGDYGPLDLSLIENCLKYYEGIDIVMATSLYLDMCNTLFSAKSSDFTTLNNPHVVLYNKSVALAKIINDYNKSLSN